MANNLKSAVESIFYEKVKNSPGIHNAYMLIHSDTRNIHWNMAAGKTGDTPSHPNQVFHAASIGKTFTSTIFAMLREKGVISYEDYIADFLPDPVMNGLHFYRNKDYSHQIQIKHLLTHTSGLPHFAEEKPKRGPVFLEIALREPHRLWTPVETIEWSKEHLKAHFAPGRGCYYSETGYNILGLIIEKVTSKPYCQVLHEYLFTPLGMDNSSLSQHSRPAKQSVYPPANIYRGRQEIQFENYPSFSAFYAAGQTANTSEDLLSFMRALTENRLISKESFQEMQQWRKLWTGVDYGYGLMKIRMLPWTQKYNGFGHMGSIGSYMFYFPALDIYIIANFNQTTFTRTGMIFILNILRAIEKGQ